MSAWDRLDEIQARAEKAEEVLGIYLEDWYLSEDVVEDVMHGIAAADVPALVAALRAVLAACDTYEKTQGIYRIEMGQREIIRVVRAEIEAALKEGCHA